MNVRTAGPIPPAERLQGRIETVPTLDLVPPVRPPAGKRGPAAVARVAGWTSPPVATPIRPRFHVSWLRFAVMVLVAVLAFGLLGLVAMAPALRARRRRRTAVCGVCRRSHRRWTAVSVALASLTLVGSGLWLAHVEPEVRRCSVTTSSGGTSLPGVRSDREAGVGLFVHRVVNAPASGLGIAYANWQGYTLCDLRNPLVTGVPLAGVTSGFTVGDLYMTAPTLDAGETEALARHEVRHSDQWAVLTILGGTLLLPVAYMVDDSMYPKSLNHFEQAAGLSDGGYTEAPARPGPQPWALSLWTLVALVVCRTRLRLLFRTVTGRLGSPRPQRCGRHTPGW
jgi:hypothetical protein